MRIAESLWHDQTLRQLVVEQAQHATSSNVKVNVNSAADPLNSLPLPLGWGGPAGGLPNGFWDVLLKVLGILITRPPCLSARHSGSTRYPSSRTFEIAGPSLQRHLDQTISNAGASGT